MKGDPRCSFCHGAGVVRSTNGYRKCSCIIADARTRAANKRAAELRTGKAPLTIDDMLTMGSSERRANTDAT